MGVDATPSDGWSPLPKVVTVGRLCGQMAVALLIVPALAACSAGAPRTAGRAVTATSEGPSTSAPPTRAVVTTVAVTAASHGTPAPTTTVVNRTTPAPAPAANAPEGPALTLAGAAGQVVVVTAPKYGATTATLTAYQRQGGGWQQVFGPWPAYVGTAGVAPPGEKREGDGRTPSGVYGFDFFFGVAADPGVKFPYRRITSRSIVWDDDPASARYDTWVDLDTQDAGTRPEPMYVRPAYDHGAAIGYNPAHTPGLGSAIFLHVSAGRPTAGCVSLPAGQLVEILRWLDPAQSPRVVIGVAS